MPGSQLPLPRSLLSAKTLKVRNPIHGKGATGKGVENVVVWDYWGRKRLCQLEGSDFGGRSRRPSWHWRVLSL
jgi:hypothetical protein